MKLIIEILIYGYIIPVIYTFLTMQVICSNKKLVEIVNKRYPNQPFEEAKYEFSTLAFYPGVNILLTGLFAAMTIKISVMYLVHFLTKYVK